MYFEIEDIGLIILLIGAVIIPIIIKIVLSLRRPKNEINFDEFEDTSKIKVRDNTEKEDIKHEANVMSKVYSEAFQNSLNQNSGIGILSHLDALEQVEKAQQDIENFKIVDSIEAEEEQVYEKVPIHELRQNGNNMEIELFKKWARGIFGCLKIGKEEQLNVVKEFITDELYSKYFLQAKAFEKDGIEFVTEDLLIKNCNIYDYGRSLDKEEIKVLIEADMKEYIIRKQDKKVLRGNNQNYITKKVLLTFVKKESVDKEGLTTTNCPNCGAPTHQTDLGRCQACGTIILPIRYNWTLIKFETM